MVVSMTENLISRLEVLVESLEPPEARAPGYTEVRGDLRSSIRWLREEPASPAAIDNGRWLLRHFKDELAFQLSRDRPTPGV